MVAVLISENAWTVILMIVAIAIALALVAYLGKKRTQALEKAAAEMGFSFDKKGAALLRELSENLHLLRQGASRTLSNAMRANDGAAIFDFQFQTGASGTQQRGSIRQTVAAFRFSAAMLPEFYLGAEHWWHKAASALGYQMIQFDTHPAFSKRYLLRGPSENALRLFFVPPLLDYFQSLPEKPAWSVEAAGPWLLIYEPRKTVKPELLRSFIDTTRGMAGEIATRAGIRQNRD